MNCDSYFEIGHSHSVCQDYALHGAFGNMSYIIVSDGCSASKHSEIGAQILCHVAKYYLSLYYHTGTFKECTISVISSLLGNSILERADEIRKLYQIPREALEATLLIAFSFDDRTLTFIWGDGIIIEKYKLSDGLEHIHIVEISYPSNAPFYLVYDKDKYAAKIDDPKVFYKHHYISKNDHHEKNRDNTFSIPYTFEYGSDPENTEKLISITISSDGMSSYKNEKKDSINLIDIFSEFTKFKATDGEFVKRRMKFFKRQAQKKQWTHFDDISCGTIIR